LYAQKELLVSRGSFVDITFHLGLHTIFAAVDSLAEDIRYGLVFFDAGFFFFDDIPGQITSLSYILGKTDAGNSQEICLKYENKAGRQDRYRQQDFKKGKSLIRS
jgi:hypothetical protein